MAVQRPLGIPVSAAPATRRELLTLLDTWGWVLLQRRGPLLHVAETRLDAEALSVLLPPQRVWVGMPPSRMLCPLTPRAASALPTALAAEVDALVTPLGDACGGVVLPLGAAGGGSDCAQIETWLARLPVLPFGRPWTIRLRLQALATAPDVVQCLTDAGCTLAIAVEPFARALPPRAQQQLLTQAVRALQQLDAHAVAYLSLDNWTVHDTPTGLLAPGTLPPCWSAYVLTSLPLSVPLLLTRPNLTQAVTDGAVIRTWDVAPFICPCGMAPSAIEHDPDEDPAHDCRYVLAPQQVRVH